MFALRHVCTVRLAGNLFRVLFPRETSRGSVSGAAAAATHACEPRARSGAHSRPAPVTTCRATAAETMALLAACASKHAARRTWNGAAGSRGARVRTDGGESAAPVSAFSANRWCTARKAAAGTRATAACRTACTTCSSAREPGRSSITRLCESQKVFFFLKKHQPVAVF